MILLQCDDCHWKANTAFFLADSKLHRRVREAESLLAFSLEVINSDEFLGSITTELLRYWFWLILQSDNARLVVKLDTIIRNSLI